MFEHQFLKTSLLLLSPAETSFHQARPRFEWGGRKQINLRGLMILRRWEEGGL